MPRCARRDHEQVGTAAVDDGAFLAVEHPTVPGPARPRGDMPQIIARSTLRLGEGELGLALDKRRQDALPLCFRPTARHELTAQTHGGEVRFDDQPLADGFHHDHHVDRVAAEATIRRVERHPEQAHVRQSGPHVLAVTSSGGHDLGARVEGIVGGQEALEGVGEELLLFAIVEVHRVSSALIGIV